MILNRTKNPFNFKTKRISNKSVIVPYSTIGIKPLKPISTNVSPA